MGKLYKKILHDETGSYEYWYRGEWGALNGYTIHSIKRLTDDRNIYSREW